MAISSSSLFHFTSGDLSTLKSILNSGFRVNRYKEIHPLDSMTSLHVHVPMVCFCDIPLTLVKKHTEIYCYNGGEKVYALGMTKEWSIENGLNPLIYLNQESHLARILQRLDVSTTKDIMIANELKLLLKEYEERESNSSFFQKIQRLSNHEIEFNDPARIVGKMIMEKISDGNYIELLNTFSRSLLYTKQYKGDYYRNGSKIPNYVFYNEREWRYIPPVNLVYAFINPIPPMFKHYVQSILKLTEDQAIYTYLKNLFDETRKRPFDSFSSMLSFNLDDISKIIVDNDSDAENLINSIENQFTICGIEIPASDKVKFIRKISTYDDLKKNYIAH